MIPWINKVMKNLCPQQWWWSKSRFHIFLRGSYNEHPFAKSITPASSVEMLNIWFKWNNYRKREVRPHIHDWKKLEFSNGVQHLLVRAPWKPIQSYQSGCWKWSATPTLSLLKFKGGVESFGNSWIGMYKVKKRDLKGFQHLLLNIWGLSAVMQGIKSPQSEFCLTKKMLGSEGL